jgi:glycosyltransferase involved in cell wall biosynthesis
MNDSRASAPATHVLAYAQDLSGGGVERALLRLAAGWLAAGRRVTLVVGDADGPLAGEMPDGLAIVRFAGSLYPAMFGLPGIVRRLAPDLIFCPGNHYTAVAAWTKLRLGAACPPIVAKMSNAPDRRGASMLFDLGHYAWLAGHGRFLDALVAMTPATARAADHALRMDGRVAVIPNPPVVPRADAALPPLPPGRFMIGVGRLVPQKRWDRLIAALPHLADRRVPLVILGEGAERRALERQVRDLGLRDRVFLPGHVGDPLPAIARAAVLVLPSDFEGVPGVLRESLSVGTPVVATDSSVSVAEIVDGPDKGSVVARDDQPALIAALDRWLRANVVRPAPMPQPGADSAARYLALFDALVAARG